MGVSMLATNTAGSSGTPVVEWAWGYRLVGDPLVRADDKFAARRYGGAALARLVNSLRDPRAKADIRRHAEEKLVTLRSQLDDVLAAGRSDLEEAARREVADQSAYVELIEVDPVR
jgi:hypothetical protein